MRSAPGPYPSGFLDPEIPLSLLALPFTGCPRIKPLEEGGADGARGGAGAGADEAEAYLYVYL